MTRLYVVHHQDVKLIEPPCLIPIRSDRLEGENIAAKENYCELRAHYWVWKNTVAAEDEYIGFFHYRRHLDFTRGKVLPLPAEKRPLPYRIVPWPRAEQYTPERILDCVQGFDAIAPIWEYTGLTVRERYAQSPGQRGEDLALVYRILQEKYPQFISAADTYLDCKGEYYANMFIMRRLLFEAYCIWLFGILEEFDKRAVSLPPRTNGFLGERLFGIYFTWLQSQPGLHLGELPQLHFSGYDDVEHRFAIKKMVNFLLPPGSLQRAYSKRIINRIYKGDFSK